MRILSSLHESGQYLDRLTGVAALLRFPMPELDDLCESDQDENEDPLLGVAGGGGDYSDDDENGVWSKIKCDCSKCCDVVEGRW